MEFKGLRRQNPSSGVNAARMGPTSPLLHQLAAASPRAAQPKLQRCRPSYLLNNGKFGKGQGGEHALLCQQSLPLASPVVGAQQEETPKLSCCSASPGPSPASCYFVERRAHILGAARVVWVEGRYILCPTLPQLESCKGCGGKAMSE